MDHLTVFNIPDHNVAISRYLKETINVSKIFLTESDQIAEWYKAHTKISVLVFSPKLTCCALCKIFLSSSFICLPVAFYADFASLQAASASQRIFHLPECVHIDVNRMKFERKKFS